jgi:hypothetical protein
MKTMNHTLAIVATFVLTLVVSCGGPLEADLGPDVTVVSPSGTPDAGYETSVETSACNPTSSDCDGDGRLGTSDCMPFDATVYGGAVEVCGNGKDDDCDVQIDEGCGQPTLPTGQSIDADKDGSWTLTDQPDCDDNDPAVKPGATEACDGKDNDCDGQKDEGCTAAPPTPRPDGTTLTCTFIYPNVAPRTLSVQVYDHKSDLGGWWEAGKSVSDNDKDLVLSLAHVQPDVCGFRFSVSEGNPPSSWLCMGNGTTAALDPNVGVSCTFADKTAAKANLKVWSHPSGVASGCSAVWQVNSHPDCSF